MTMRTISPVQLVRSCSYYCCRSTIITVSTTNVISPSHRLFSGHGLSWTPKNRIPEEWTERVLYHPNPSSTAEGLNDDDDFDSSDALPARQLGVLHPNPSIDLERLMKNYTVPALASAIREREDALQQAALLAQQGQFQELQQMLQVFHPDLVQERRRQRQDVNLAQTLSLEQIRKTLARLPRTVVTAHQKRAAVVIALGTVNQVPSLLLEQRSWNIKHPGQVCLPGGMVCEVADQTVVDTCLREMREEIAGLPSSIQVLGVFRTQWSDVHHLVGVAVTPVVCYFDDFDLSQCQLEPNPDEVNRVFTIAIADLINPDYWCHPPKRAPVFRGGPLPIWGLTGYILDKFNKDVLLPHCQTS